MIIFLNNMTLVIIGRIIYITKYMTDNNIIELDFNSKTL